MDSLNGFDAERVLETVRNICAVSKFIQPMDPRRVLTRELVHYLRRGRKRLDVFLRMFKQLGYTITLQHTRYDGKLATSALITKGSTIRSRTLLFTAHHDYCAGLGAEDNASGMAVMLELGRILVTGDIPVAFACFDLEEAGLLGSAGYVETYKDKRYLRRLLAAVVALDCVGAGEELVICNMMEGVPSDTGIIKKLQSAASRAGLSCSTEEFRQFSSDHVPFAHIGIPAIELSSITGKQRASVHAGTAISDEQKIYSVAHTVNDTPDALRPSTLSAAGRILMEFVRSFRATHGSR